MTKLVSCLTNNVVARVYFFSKTEKILVFLPLEGGPYNQDIITTVRLKKIL